MPLVFAIFFLFVMLPYLMFKEGLFMLRTHVDKHKLWWALPYLILAVLIFIIIALLSSGYKF